MKGLIGNSKIWTSKGPLSLRECLHESNLWLLTYHNGQIKSVRTSKPVEVKFPHPIVKVNLYNGGEIYCIYDQVFFDENMNELTAESLKEGVFLKSFYSTESGLCVPHCQEVESVELDVTYFFDLFIGNANGNYFVQTTPNGGVLVDGQHI